MRTFSNILIGLLALFGACHAHADVTVRVGIGQASCNYPTIQQAITAANNVNGQTIILITRNQVYTNQQLVIDGKNVTLSGGYADCDQVLSDGQPTVINGIASTNRPLITVRGSTNFVSFERLVLTGNGNTAASAGAGFGGAAAVSGGPHVLVEFDNTSITNNSANYGGGVHVQSATGVVNVLFAGTTTINGNDGLLSGGGLWCGASNVYMTYGNASIFDNHTGGDGGGIRAENCAMEIASTISGIGSVSFNTSAGNGGGISVSGQNSLTKIYTADAAAYAFLNFNIAAGFGGAIAIEAGAAVKVWDAVIESNTGRAGGGAVYLANNLDDSTADASFEMRGDTIGAPTGPFPSESAARCVLSLRCNRLSSNQSIELDGVQRAGSAILAQATGSEIKAGLANLHFDLLGTELFGHSGLNLITMSGNYATATLSGVAMFTNSNSGTNMISITAPEPDTSAFSMRSTTIAGNTAAGTATIVKNLGVSLEYKRGVHWQPGKVLKSGAGASSVSLIDYVIANDLSGLPASVHNLQADPVFVNAAAGDFHLRLDSPAIDFASPSTDATADHLPRRVDLPVANEFGDQDLGAYERQDGCADGSDKVFCNGFEP